MLWHERHTDSFDQPYQYVGQLGYYTCWQEPDFGLLRLGVRFYDVQAGRFTQRDEVPTSASAYVYTSDSPTQFVDPRGLSHSKRSCLDMYGDWLHQARVRNQQCLQEAACDLKRCYDKCDLVFGWGGTVASGICSKSYAPWAIPALALCYEGCAFAAAYQVNFCAGRVQPGAEACQRLVSFVHADGPLGVDLREGTVTSMSANERATLFNPRDFIPTSIVWGFWAAGLMAGVNLVRAGQSKRGAWVAFLSVLGQMALWAGAIWLRLQATGTYSQQGAASPLQLRVPFASVGLVVTAINGLAGYAFYRMQRDMYRAWLADRPPTPVRSPYLPWWVSLSAIAATLLVIALVGFLYFWR